RTRRAGDERRCAARGWSSDARIFPISTGRWSAHGSSAAATADGGRDDRDGDDGRSGELQLSEVPEEPSVVGRVRRPAGPLRLRARAEGAADAGGERRAEGRADDCASAGAGALPIAERAASVAAARRAFAAAADPDVRRARGGAAAAAAGPWSRR